jgi:hypothetical protein
LKGLATRMKEFLSKLLIILGLALMALGIWNWFDVPGHRDTVVTEKTEATEQTVTTSDGGGTEREHKTDSSIEAAGSKNTTATSTKSTTTEGTSTTTEAVPLYKTTTTSTPEPSRRSEGVTLALIGAGAGLILAGAFYGRIQKLGFAGVSVELIAETGEAIAKLVASHDKTIKALSRALAKLDARVRTLEERNGKR